MSGRANVKVRKNKVKLFVNYAPGGFNIIGIVLNWCNISRLEGAIYQRLKAIRK